MKKLAILAMAAATLTLAACQTSAEKAAMAQEEAAKHAEMKDGVIMTDAKHAKDAMVDGAAMKDGDVMIDAMKDTKK